MNPRILVAALGALSGGELRAVAERMGVSVDDRSDVEIPALECEDNGLSERRAERRQFHLEHRRQKFELKGMGRR